MKKTLSIILCAIMLLGLLPMEARAAQKIGEKITPEPKPSLKLTDTVKSGLSNSRAINLDNKEWDCSVSVIVGDTIHWQINNVTGVSLQYKFDVYQEGELYFQDGTWESSNRFEMKTTEPGWFEVIVLIKDASDGDVNYIKGPEIEVAWPTYISLDTPKITSVTAVSGTSLKTTWTKLTWADVYHVFCSADKAYWQEKRTTATSFTYTGLTAGTLYYCFVYAEAFGGDHYEFSPESAILAGVPLAKATISSLVSAGAGKLKITWAKVPGASGYRLLRSATAGGVYTLVKATTATTFTNTGLAKGKVFFYKVQPYKRISTTNYYGPLGAYKSAKVK